MSAEATSTTSAPVAAAPAAQAPTPNQSTPAQPDAQGGEQAAPDADPWAVKLPQVKPQNVRERLVAKQERLAAQQQQQTIQSQFEALKGQYEQLTSAEQKANARFSELMQQGNVSEALKVKGVSASFEDLQRAELVRLGAISDAPRDPRVDSLEAKLKSYEDAEQKRQEQARMRQQQQAQQREWQEGLAAVRGELEALPLPGAKEFAALPNVDQAILHIMMQDPNVQLDQAAAFVRRDYAELHKELDKVFGTAAKAPIAVAAKPTPAQRVSGGPRRVAPTPQQSVSGGTLAERRAAAMKKAITGRT